MTARSEMTIPRSRSEIVFQIVIMTVAVLFCILGTVNLFNRVAIIPSTIWFVFVIAMMWRACREEGGFRRFLTYRLALLGGRFFVECSPHSVQPAEVHFGYRILGHRYLQREVLLDKIESVEWRPGQGSDMAGRDMKDWSVHLWFDQDDPVKRNKWSRKPEQGIHIVGPARRKEETEAFGLSFVDFLRDAGASLVRGEGDCIFVRKELEKTLESIEQRSERDK